MIKAILKSFSTMLEALFSGSADFISINMNSAVTVSNQGLLSAKTSLIEDIESSNLTEERIAQATSKAKALGITL